MKSPIFKSPVRAYKLFLLGIVTLSIGVTWNALAESIYALLFEMIGVLLIIDALIVHSRRKKTKP